MWKANKSNWRAWKTSTKSNVIIKKDNYGTKIDGTEKF